MHHMNHYLSSKEFDNLQRDRSGNIIELEDVMYFLSAQQLQQLTLSDTKKYTYHIQTPGSHALEMAQQYL